MAAGVVVRKPDGSGLSPYDLKRLQVCKCVQLCVCVRWEAAPQPNVGGDLNYGQRAREWRAEQLEQQRNARVNSTSTNRPNCSLQLTSGQTVRYTC